MFVALSIFAAVDLVAFVVLTATHFYRGAIGTRGQSRVGRPTKRDMPGIERARRRRNLQGAVVSIIAFVLFFSYGAGPAFGANLVLQAILALVIPFRGASPFFIQFSVVYVTFAIFAVAGATLFVVRRRRSRLIDQILSGLSVLIFFVIVGYIISSMWSLTWWGDVLMVLIAGAVIVLYVSRVVLSRWLIAELLNAAKWIRQSIIPLIQQFARFVLRFMRFIGTIPKRLEPFAARAETRLASTPLTDFAEKAESDLDQEEEIERQVEERTIWGE
jgi:hypothetical protein